MPKVIHQTNTKQILKEARIFLPLLATTLLTVASASVLSSHTSTALDQNSVSASVKVSESCAMTISGADSHSVELVGGMVEQKIGESTISVACNDINGYSIYAVGYGNGTEGNTNLTGTTTGEIIPTGTDIPETSGTPVSQSQWAMRLSAVSSEFVPTIVSDSEGSFASNHKIPSTNTKVATFTNNISLTGFSKISTTYAVGVIPYQAADTYTGQVKYTLVHPNFADSNQRVYMQDLTPSMIADLLPNVGNTFVAYDKRDNQSYKIAKLADGKYWMVENLNLAGGTTITPADSNVTESYTMPASSETGFDDNTVAYVYNTNNKTSDCANGCYSYYSYLAATAGTDISTTSSYANAPSSICPKGWRLPTSNTSNAATHLDGNWKTGDLYGLVTAYGADLESTYLDDSSETGANFFNNAGPNTLPNFILNGYDANSNIYTANLRGYYWTSTFGRNDSGNSYTLQFGSDYVNFAHSQNRRLGLAVRCLFDHQSLSDITTMQEMTPTIAAYTPQGTTATLTDSRGGVTKSYTVAKLADNKVWMTSNLDLPGGTTVTPADSDVTANFTLPASATKNADNTNLTDSTQFTDENTAYVFNSGNNTNCGAAEQYTVPCGSYYSYNAATAGTGATMSSDGHNASSSICPKGWRLPTATTSNANATADNNWKTGDFYALATAYGANLESDYKDDSVETKSNFYNNAGPNTIPNFLLAGDYNYGVSYGFGFSGYYWSSTTEYGGPGALYLLFGPSQVRSAQGTGRRYGLSVRCLANS